MDIKIVSLRVDRTKVDALIESDRDGYRQISRVCEWSLQPDAETMLSERFTSVSPKLEEAKAVLRSALGEGGFTVVDRTAEFDFYVTTAPAEYDYTAYNMEVCVIGPDDRGKAQRIVALQKQRAEYQLGRYGSGLYGARKL